MSIELDLQPFARLANLGLAPRVRGLLEGTFQAAVPVVEAALVRALDELDRDLLAHTERGSNIAEQNQCFASLREFRQRRGDFLIACRSAIQRSLLVLVDTSVFDDTFQVITVHVDSADPGAPDAVAQEEGLTLSQIATRAEIRAGASLQALSYRLGVIAGSAPIEIEALALGPYKLCAALRSAARRFDVFPPHRLALYRRIDKCLFAEPAALYDAINGYLIGHRVYAHLQLAPRAAAPAAPDLQPAVHDPMPTPVAAPNAPQPVPAPAVPPPTPARQAFQQLLQSDQHEPARGHADAAKSGRELPLDAQFFRILRERVSLRRNATQSTDAAADGGRALADRRELHAALSTLQAQPLAPVMVGGKWVNRSVAHIKQDLMNQLRSLGDGGAPRLREEDSDTIDLIGLLFGRLLEAYRPNSMCHGLISRLQIPVLKVALRDSSFFTRRTHPARRLLSTVMETLADWVEDEDSDRQVVEKLQMVADRLVREYDDDLLSFDRCLEDLDKHVGSLQKKAEVAERRHVEAAKGRVKLDLARAAAYEAVQQRLAGANVPAAVAALLDSAWTDAIALALLRQGVDHPKSQERTALVDRLLAVYADAGPSDRRHRLLEDLRGPLEEGLSAVGFHDDAIVTAWNDLSGLIDAPHEQAQEAAARAMAELIRQKPRLGGDAGGLGPAHGDLRQAAVGADSQPLNPAEFEAVERIKQMEFGTWFEFTLNRQGDKARRRLCWFSAVTGRCLFVNVRGAKSEDRMIAELAREMVRGNARPVTEENADPVERAWRAVMAAMRDSQSPALPPRASNH